MKILNRRAVMRVALAVGAIVAVVVGSLAGVPATAARLQGATPQNPPLAAPVGSPTSAATGAAWVELGPEGVLLARAVTGAAACPAIVEDGVAHPMATRSAADAASFPVTVCEAIIPPGTQAAAVAGHPLPLPVGAPRRIAVIGDTGCVMEEPSYFQACNDPAAWPFPSVAQQIADWHPDLIVHVGDYFYREDPCPAADSGCAGSPSGDRWATWDADFFTPAAPMLAAAPLVVVRGNHESCARGGAGWFRLLDPRPLPAACPTYTAPYAIPVGDRRVLVLDSSAASDATAPPDQTAEYTAQFATLQTLTGPSAWLLSHKPLWGVYKIDGTGADLQISPDSVELETASGNTLPTGVELVLSGHVHRFELIGFAEAAQRPPQVVSGNAGGTLDPPVAAAPAGLALAGETFAAEVITSEFGYLTLESTGDDWTATEHAATGEARTTCAVRHLTATCNLAPPLATPVG